MKSYRSITGAKGGLAVLPTLEERSVDTELDYSAPHSRGSSCRESLSDAEGGQPGEEGNGSGYPADLLEMSWGSYLNTSAPPTRTEGQLGLSLKAARLQGMAAAEGRGEEGGSKGPTSVLHNPTLLESEAEGKEEDGKAEKSEGLLQEPHPPNEPHPLLEHLEGLMTALSRSRQELKKCGLDATPLTTLCTSTLSSHSDLKQIVRTLAKGGTNCNDIVITSDLMHNLVEYLREVLQGLVAQGKKLNVQSAFLQQTAKQLNRQQQEWLKERASCQEAIDKDRTCLNQERRALDRQRHSILAAEEELKSVLVEAEEDLKEGRRGRRKKGRMDSPHSVAQGRTQLAALIQTQKQQSRLDKLLTQQQRDIRCLQQAHDFTKSELLAVQDHAAKLQRKLAMQINEAKNSESALTSRLRVTRESLTYPSMALDKEKRKSYHGTSKAQVKATLKGIAAAQKTLNTEIERMQRQFSEQHTTERRVSRQLGENQQQLLEMGSRVKEHAADIKGTGRRINRTTVHHGRVEEEEVTLPAIVQAPAPEESSQLQDPTAHRSEGSIVLPKLDHPTAHAQIGGHSKRLSRLPTYQFSKAELFTLARFDDHETAAQVMQWLRSQGKLK